MLHFGDSERSTTELKLFFFHTLFNWVVGSGAFSIHSILELIDFVNFNSFVLCIFLVCFGFSY
jgi:hypothetical protein